MAKPTKKSPVLEGLLKTLTGKDRRVQILNNLCVTCDGEAKEFRDELSRKEYSVSGMCQSCQDNVFGTGDL